MISLKTNREMAVATATSLRELAAIKPALVVAMGATAAQSVLGKITPINSNRGRVIDLDHGMKALVTVHPSYLLHGNMDVLSMT